MTSFVSETRNMNASPDKVSAFFQKIENFRLIMPEQIENWESDGQTCSFFIKNLGKLSMQKSTFEEPHRFTFRSTPQSKVAFTLVFHYSNPEHQEPQGYFEILTQVNPLIEMMARRPLVNFVTILTDNLKKDLDVSQK